VLVILLIGGTAWAGPLELALGGGPATTSLDDVNTSILVFNTLIAHLNETLAVVPGVSGHVQILPPMNSGASFRASERYWAADWIAFTGAFEYYSLSTATRGQYIASETSTIDVSVALSTIAVLAGARIEFLDAGLRLAADASFGYFYSTCSHAVTFEIPSEYPDVIAGVPPEGEGHYSGGTFGAEAGLSIAYPIVDGVCVEALVAYRWANVPALRDATATSLDLDGNGTPESAGLDGLSVHIGFSIAIDLSLDGEEGE
jgi:hypothetical protein